MMFDYLSKSISELSKWTQAKPFLDMRRAIAITPKYMIVSKEDEVFIVDNDGNKLAQLELPEKTVDIAIDNNGRFAILYPMGIEVYNIKGELVFKETFDLYTEFLAMGTDYIWVSFESLPPKFRVYNPDYTFQEFELQVADWGLYRFECGEIGDKCWVVRLPSDGAPAKATLLDVNGTILADIDVSGSLSKTEAGLTLPYVRPDAKYALATVFNNATNYTHLRLVRDDGQGSAIIGFSVPIAIAGSRYLSKAVAVEDGYDWIHLFKFDLDTLQHESETERLPFTAWTKYGWAAVDMSPDGRYVLIQGEKYLYVYDFDNKAVIDKTPIDVITTRLRMLAKEVS